MAKIEIAFVNVNLFKKELKTEAARKLFPGMLRRAAEAARPELIQALLEAFRRTIAIKGIFGENAGNEEEDAQAHLGLTDDMAQGALEEISEAIEETLEFSAITVRSGKVGFNITFNELTSAIAGISSGSYVSDSKSGSFTIPWMDWLLNGGSVDASIIFDDSEESRSGRAVMLEKNPFGSWDVDDYERFAENENFVIDALEDETWKSESFEIMVRYIEEEIDNA